MGEDIPNFDCGPGTRPGPNAISCSKAAECLENQVDQLGSNPGNRQVDQHDQGDQPFFVKQISSQTAQDGENIWWIALFELTV